MVTTTNATVLFCNTSTKSYSYKYKYNTLIYQLRKCRGHNNRRCSFTQSYKYTAVLKYYKKPKYNDKKEAMLYKHTYDDVHISAPQVPWSQQPTQQCCFAILVKIIQLQIQIQHTNISAPQVPWSQQPTQQCCFAISTSTKSYSYKYKYNTQIYQLHKCHGHKNQRNSAVLQY